MFFFCVGPVYTEARIQLWMPFLRWDLLVAWTPPDGSIWLVKKPQRSAFVHLPNCGNMCMSPCPAFVNVCSGHGPHVLYDKFFTSPAFTPTLFFFLVLM